MAKKDLLQEDEYLYGVGQSLKPEQPAPEGTVPAGQQGSVPAEQPAPEETGIVPQGTDYGSLADQYLQKYADGKFQYNFNDDPTYQMAREAYLKQGQLNARDVAARAAALTGGYGNSYGTVAAQQTMNAAADRVNQIIPELEANAYNRWNAEQQRNLGLAEMYYGRQQDLDEKALRDAQLAAEYGDYSKLNALGYDTSQYEADEAAEREWRDKQRAQAEKEWQYADEDRKREIAIQMAKLGDYSFAEELGLDVSQIRKEQDFTEEQRAQVRREWQYADEDRKRQLAQFAAQYGDYTFLEQLGVDVTEYKKAQQLDEALAIASAVGDYSGLKALGIDVSTAEKQALLKIALQYADVGDLSLLKELGVDVTLLEAQNNYKLGQLSGYGYSGGGGGYSYNPGYTPGPDDDDEDEDEDEDVDEETEKTTTEKDYTVEDKIEAYVSVLLRKNGLKDTGITVQALPGGKNTGWYVVTTADGTQYKARYDAKRDTYQLEQMDV